MRRFQCATAVLIALGTPLVQLGCSTQRLPTEPFPSHFPQRHSSPTWSATGVLAYEDLGVTCVDASGGYSLDTTRAGVWLDDPRSVARFRFLGGYTSPAWNVSGTLLAAVGTGRSS
jgi:hypothetical protein